MQLQLRRVRLRLAGDRAGRSRDDALAGSNPAPSDAYQDTLFDSCSNGAIEPFGLDAGCWTGLKPAIQLVAKH